ncbi:hypothetical protein [Cytobacillus oceanisediminis]|uniref:hypothetical protein n=1 Tax=Cytobacillus oceanisediminis TaxID=665099 RepID=UPI001FB5384B|nr:hypothetical protein [Cytobacillus oceanisediminis]UOE58014.1 hypothetical protein IRB79_27500 [Cytobacillus oceanisediminis]
MLFGLYLLNGFLVLISFLVLLAGGEVFPYNIIVFIVTSCITYILWKWVLPLLFGEKRYKDFLKELKLLRPESPKKTNHPKPPIQYLITGIDYEGKRITPRTVIGTENISFYTYGIQHGTVWIITAGKRMKYKDIHN